MEHLIKNALRSSTSKSEDHGGGGYINGGQPHTIDKMKILITGHSWVSQLERYYDQKRHNPHHYQVYFVRLNTPRFEDITPELLYHVEPDMTHIFIFSIFWMAYRRHVKHLEGKEYSVIVPNLDFEVSDAVPIISDMVKQIMDQAPASRVYIMIPTLPDLHYYNVVLNIGQAPDEVRKWYDMLPRTSRKKLCADTGRIYRELKRLHTKEFTWPMKHTMLVSDAVYNIGVAMKLKKEELEDPNNEIISLFNKGYLSDGIHPTQALIDELWNLFESFQIFHRQILKPKVQARPKNLTIRSRNFYPSRRKVQPEPSSSTGVTDHNRNKIGDNQKYTQDRSSRSSLRTPDSNKRSSTQSYSSLTRRPIKQYRHTLDIHSIYTPSEYDTLRLKYASFFSYLLGTLHSKGDFTDEEARQIVDKIHEDYCQNK